MCMYARVYAHVYACVCAYMYNMHACIYVYMYECMYVNRCVCMYPDTYYSAFKSPVDLATKPTALTTRVTQSEALEQMKTLDV